MSDSARVRLIKSAATLQRRSHEEWKQFFEALTIYADEVTAQVISAPIGVLPTAQGRAQAVHELLSWLTEPALASDKIMEKRDGRGISAN